MFRLIHRKNRVISLVFSCKSENSVNEYVKRLSVLCITHPNTHSPNVKNNFSFHRTANIATNMLPDVKTNRSEQNLHELIKNISFNIEHKSRVYKEEVMEAITMLPEKQLDKKNSLILIKACSSFLVNEPPKERMFLLDKLLKTLGSAEKDSDYYNEILKCFIDNNHNFDAVEFLEQMKPSKPSEATYQLLITAMCKIGNMQQALEILNIMENERCSISQATYNSLIEGHGKQKNIPAVLQIIEIMKLKEKKLSSETEKSILLAYILNQNSDLVKERLKYLADSHINFSDSHFLDVINYCCQNNMDGMIPNILSLSSPQQFLSMPMDLTYVCTQLIYQGFANGAFSIYNHIYKLIPKSDVMVICLKNMIKATITTLNVPKDIDNVLFSLSEINKDGHYTLVALKEALRQGKYDTSLHLIKTLKENEKSIKCHYFWPLFVAAAKNESEADIFKILTGMNEMGIAPDFDTFNDYVIPNININDSSNLIKKFDSLNIATSTYFTSLISYLLKSGEIRSASDLCELTDVSLDCQKLIFPLINSIFSTYDTTSTHNILKTFTTKSINPEIDWIGKFLVNFVSHRNWKSDMKFFHELIQALCDSNTKVSIDAVQRCINSINKRNLEIKDDNIIRINLLSMVEKNGPAYVFKDSIEDNQKYPDVNELEKQYSQLKSKGEFSAGVLKRLFSRHVQLGNSSEAENILKTFNNENLNITSGMKSSIMYLYIKENDLQNAEKYYLNIKREDPSFLLDDFKLLDYCSLLVKNNQLITAIDILEKTAKKKVKGGLSVEMNCWLLLNTVATNMGPADTEKMLSLLTRLGYCNSSNILLGPLVRAHLIRNDINGAVNEFINCANKYRKTPLKHELLCILVKGSSSKENILGYEKNKRSPEKEVQLQNEYKNLLVKVQECEKKVYGVNNSRLSLIFALADTGLKVPLRRFVLDPSVILNQSAIMQQCERFLKEKKLAALEAMGECLEGLKNIQTNEIYDLIIKAHELDNNCDGAIDILKSMNEKKIKPKDSTIKTVTSMLQLHNKEFPPDLMRYSEK